MAEGIRIISSGPGDGVSSIVNNVMGDLLSIDILSLHALPLFWLPLVACLIRTIFRLKGAYYNDVRLSNRDDYTPSLTAEFIAFRLLVSVVPGLNLLAFIYYLASFIDRVSSTPLVPKKDSKG